LKEIHVQAHVKARSQVFKDMGYAQLRPDSCSHKKHQEQARSEVQRKVPGIGPRPVGQEFPNATPPAQPDLRFKAHHVCRGKMIMSYLGKVEMSY
jgi:hypothetical protein